jgi:hypothetical protein
MQLQLRAAAPLLCFSGKGEKKSKIMLFSSGHLFIA